MSQACCLMKKSINKTLKSLLNSEDSFVANIQESKISKSLACLTHETQGQISTMNKSMQFLLKNRNQQCPSSPAQVQLKPSLLSATICFGIDGNDLWWKEPFISVLPSDKCN